MNGANQGELVGVVRVAAQKSPVSRLKVFRGTLVASVMWSAVSESSFLYARSFASTERMLVVVEPFQRAGKMTVDSAHS